jgi:hypothetical protein
MQPWKVERLAPTAAINLDQKLATFADRWAPKIVETFNGHDVMVVKVKGEFVWHSHAELYVVPRGVEHCPVALEETHLLLIEPHGEPNTGDPATAATKEAI